VDVRVKAEVLLCDAMATLDTADLLLPTPSMCLDGMPAFVGVDKLSSQTYLEGKEPLQPQPETNWLFQLRVLVVRFVRTWYRSPQLLASFVLQHIFAGVFMGKRSRPQLFAEGVTSIC